MDQATQNWSVQGLLFVCWLAPYDRSRELAVYCSLFLGRTINFRAPETDGMPFGKL